MIAAAKFGYAGTIFTLSGNVDATQFGLSSSQLLTISWSYDPAQTPDATLGGPPPVRAFYENINATFQVGAFVIPTTSEIVIDDNNPGTGDQFNLLAASFVSGTSLSGNINGIAVGEVNLSILDQTSPFTMFSSLNLPGNASFADAATLVKVEIDSVGNADQIIQLQFSPGNLTLTSADGVPEPGTLGLCCGAGLVLALAGKRAWNRRG